jgi:hypothetical protein
LKVRDLISALDVLRIEDTCDEETLFIDVSNKDEQMGEIIGEFVQDVVHDTEPAPPMKRHLELVR